MKHSVRSFSIGMLTTVLVIGFTYMNANEPSAKIKKEDLTMEEMISEIEAEGYHVMSEAEKDKSQNEKQKKESVETAVSTFSIDIVQGSSLTEISKKLAKAKIIDDPQAFETFMEDNDYSRYIQIGQATLTSDMSHQEIAKMITSK